MTAKCSSRSNTSIVIVRRCTGSSAAPAGGRNEARLGEVGFGFGSGSVSGTG
jgi:hypothetical protein